VYTENTQFEWDAGKAERNAAKHGIDFPSAALAFDDPCAFIMEDFKHSRHEPRQWLIGGNGTEVLVVVFTLRLPRGRIRIISARRANRRERGIYEENKGV
jgi:uncharacterized DUF497 family protein